MKIPSTYKKRRNERIRKRALIILIVLALIGITNSIPGCFLRAIPLSLYDIFTGPTIHALFAKTYEESEEIYLEKVDSKFTTAFYSSGGSVVLDDQPFLDNSYGSTATAFYSRSKNTIFIKHTVENKTMGVVVHELGHFLDKGNIYSESDEFVEIAQKEIIYFTAADALTDSTLYPYKSYQESGTFREYFADAFCYYYTRPTVLKSVAPETYNYIKNLAEE